MNNKELLNKIEESVKKRGLDVVFGAFGDMKKYGGKYQDLISDEVFDGVVEKYYSDEENGSLIKFWGCDYAYKGTAFNHNMKIITLGKALIARLPLFFLKSSFVLKMYFGFLFLFRRKKFWHLMRVPMAHVYEGTVKKIARPYNEYNRFGKEIKRVFNNAINKRMINDTDLFITDETVNDEYESLRFMKCFSDFVVTVLYEDDSYRYMAQDLLGELDQDLVNHPASIVMEFGRIMDIFIERHQSIRQKRRFKFIKRGLMLMFYLSDEMKEWLEDILLNINIKKVEMDDSDLFFSLLKRNYNVKGLNLKERIQLRNRLNKKSNRKKVALSVSKKQNDN